MNDFTGLVFVLFLVIGALIVLLFKRTNTRHKPSVLKKDELIKKYEYEMYKLIAKYESDKDLLQEKKVEFLKTASYELHNNIFFDEAEAKQVIKRLASL